MFASFFEQVAQGTASAVKAGLSPVGPYLRMLSMGATLVLLSSFAWAVALLFLSLAIFFQLSLWEIYVAPALWVALLNGLLGGSLMYFGLRMIRRPR